MTPIPLEVEVADAPVAEPWDPDGPTVEVGGRIIRDGVVEAEAEGRTERGEGTVWLNFTSFGALQPADFAHAPVADVFWFETTMERLARQRPDLPWH